MGILFFHQFHVRFPFTRALFLASPFPFPLSIYASFSFAPQSLFALVFFWSLLPPPQPKLRAAFRPDLEVDERPLQVARV